MGKPSWSMNGKGVSKKEDRWFSQAVRHRDNWMCRNPGCEATRDRGDQIDCAHIQSRRHLNTRWDPRNAVALCRKCHGYMEDHPYEFIAMLKAIGYSEDQLFELHSLSHTPFKAPDHVRQAISDHYRLEYRRMEKAGTHDLRPYGEGHEDDEAPLRRAGRTAG